MGKQDREELAKIVSAINEELEALSRNEKTLKEMRELLTSPQTVFGERTGPL